MELQGLSDDDLVAVISYLRSQSAVRHPVPAHRYTLLGRVVRATVLAHPVGPPETPPAVSPRGATLENGRYLVESAALCWACHTQRSKASGKLTGPRYGGATGMVESFDPHRAWAAPNITADPETGRLAAMTEDQFVELQPEGDLETLLVNRLAAMTEDQFVARFRAGRLLPGSPMPWPGYQRMAEDDLRAMYRYLKTVPTVRRDVGPPITEVK